MQDNIGQQEIGPDHNDVDSDQVSEHKIPILFLWFGEKVPEDYLISLSELAYPYIFLKNPHIDRIFKRPLLDV